MICTKCGTIGVDKYCAHCGTRLKTPVEVYRSYQRKAAKKFEKECLQYRTSAYRQLSISHLSTACWLASESRYGIEHRLGPNYILTQADIDNLVTVRDHAMLLFRTLIAF